MPVGTFSLWILIRDHLEPRHRRGRWATGKQHPSRDALTEEEEENDAKVPALAVQPLYTEAVSELPLYKEEEEEEGEETLDVERLSSWKRKLLDIIGRRILCHLLPSKNSKSLSRTG